jgi:aspartate-semialdehyde dehydrogenase
MAGRVLRGAVVGASTLLGKELADELNDAKVGVWDLTLLDGPDAGGQITAAGDEALVIQAVSAEAFAGVDVVFFAGEAATAREYWQAAHVAGASVVDLTGALEGMPGVLVRAGFMEGRWVEAGTAPDLATVAVVVAHPMAAVLAVIETKLRPLGLVRLAATVLLPASEMGSAGVDELHQQTVGLLSFQPLQKDVYDAQVAFNVLASLGGAAKVDLERVRSTIVRQSKLLAGGSSVLALQVVQIPVFHGFGASVFVEMTPGVDEAEVRRLVDGGVLRVVEQGAPSNESVAGENEMMVRLEAADEGGFWLWMAGDNLRLAVGNAAGCAQELAALRPASGVN